LCSSSQPANDPLVLWLNGGPGCSSSTGLLFELGPCSISDEGRNTTFNEYSWTTNANVIFLDQPVAVGYSYAKDGSTVNTTPVAALDVWTFLELFLIRHPKYAKAPFHIAAESYGGTYAPNIASVIRKKNQEQPFAPSPSRLRINLDSIIIGNGLTDPYVQFGSIPDFACTGPYPVFEGNSFQCSSLYSKASTCQSLTKACYNFNSRLTW
jgi:cathepsin A (carboxypeptidase C)